ncbi:unnamed protein product, partial [Allacma fusca]
MVAVDGLPLNVTSGIGFKNLVQTLSPGITVKSRHTVRRKIQKEAATVRKRNSEIDMSALSSQRIHGIADIWSTKSLQSVLGIRIQYITDDF